ncbi:hypothetical protein [Denitromonas iodatirespirans]|uniref:DUF1707 domain-containing protein n=1 Tax=Denitromonas iodatirespirans TaxID=2795389 RepID=A0A944HCB9_DENI1|nr:hypothetical protein [Denitromonas iodatirespirans]MBT0962557.1 hypothetical protein [Denitromonas iodatirespirans]
MKRIITLGAILAACTFSVPAMADRGDRVDARQDRQQHRIERGLRSGDLTRPEARRLERGQDRIDRLQHRAYADGRVTPRERARIHQEVKRQDRHIYRERHDRQVARHGDRGWHRGHAHAPAYGYYGYRPVVRHVPVHRRVIVDREPSISLILNLP